MFFSTEPLDIDHVARRHERFRRMECEPEPILAIQGGQAKLPAGVLPAETRIIEPDDLRFELLMDDLQGLRAVFGGWDCAPTVLPAWEVPWVELIMGCRVEVSDGNFCTRGLGDREAFLEREELEIRERWLEKLVSVYHLLEARRDRRYGISTTLVRGASDLLAALIGHEDMCLLMVDDPELAYRLLGLCTKTALRIVESQLAAIRPLEGHWVNRFGVWAPGPTVVFQEDAAVLLSPGLYRDLVLPWDKEMAGSVPYPVFHIHSPCVSYVVPELLEVEEVGAIQIRVDPTGPSLEELLPHMRAVQERKPLIVSGDFSAEHIASLTENLEPGWLEVIAGEQPLRTYLRERGLVE